MYGMECLEIVNIHFLGVSALFFGIFIREGDALRKSMKSSARFIEALLDMLANAGRPQLVRTTNPKVLLVAERFRAAAVENNAVVMRNRRKFRTEQAVLFKCTNSGEGCIHAALTLTWFGITT